MNLPLAAVQRQIASALDIIIHLGRLRDKSRKVLQITEIEKYESGKIHTRTLYEFREEEGMEHGKIKGRLMKVAELSNQESSWLQDIKKHEYLIGLAKSYGYFRTDPVFIL